MLFLFILEKIPVKFKSISVEIEEAALEGSKLTTLILSLVVCLANIGIALFGFLLFKTPGEF